MHSPRVSRTRPLVSLIVAMGKNRVIGHNNGIPWHLPEDLKIFKRRTMGHHMIMGRKTYESIGRVLPGRTTVIVTRREHYKVPGAIVVHSLEEAVAASNQDSEVFVIGGADIFREALPIADRIYLSVVDAAPDGDTFMPPWDDAEWREAWSEPNVGFRSVVLERTPPAEGY